MIPDAILETDGESQVSWVYDQTEDPIERSSLVWQMVGHLVAQREILRLEVTRLKARIARLEAENATR